MVCAAPAYLARHAPIASPLDLTTHNCLTYRINLGETVWRFVDADSEMVAVPVSGSFQTDNGHALLEAVRAGVGIGLMPDWAIRTDLNSGRLRRLFPDQRVSYTEFDNGIYAVYQQTHKTLAKVRVFIEFIVRLFQEQLSGGDAAAAEAPREPGTMRRRSGRRPTSRAG